MFGKENLLSNGNPCRTNLALAHDANHVGTLIQMSEIKGLGTCHLFIEGFHSINAASQPLIVIDGVVHDMMYSSTMLHNGYWNNPLANINIDDIAETKVKVESLVFFLLAVGTLISAALVP